MKYIIFGTNRVAKDFRYIFDDLDIMYHLKEKDEEIVIENILIRDLEYALGDKSYDKIIICDFNKINKEKILKENGLEYGKHYIFEEDFFQQLDEIVIPKDKKVAIWGTGNMCHLLLEVCPDLQFDFFLDNYKKSDCIRGIPVYSPEEITNWNSLYIIIAIARDSDIINQLDSMGLKKNEDYIGYRKIIALPSRMLKRTIFDKSNYDLECNTMLNHLEILRDGNTRCCCTTFVKEDLDNVIEKDIVELWHSHLHKIMCLSTENKTFTFCDKSMCPLFVAKKNQNENISKREYKEMEKYPKILALGYDSTCNLSCVTCREHLYVASGNDLNEVCKISQKVNEQYLPHADFLIIAGEGEVFASKAYKEVYNSPKCNPKFIRILSNGMLFNARNWAEFSKNKKGSIMLTISVDAASKETYEKIRRNGKFDVLKKNMELASQLRKSGELRYFRMNFVVQRENYKEMIPFVQWGEELGVDEIFFTKILNWGTYTKEEFAKISMMESDGITPKEELKEVLAHPVMQSGIVDLGTIQYSHKIDTIDIVDNYYIWELEKRGGKL